jgi:hypothetical protein
LCKPVLDIVLFLLFKQTYPRRCSIFAGERGDKYPLSVGKWYLTD